MVCMHTSPLFLGVRLYDMSNLASNHRGRKGNSLPRASAPYHEVSYITRKEHSHGGDFTMTNESNYFLSKDPGRPEVRTSGKEILLFRLLYLSIRAYKVGHGLHLSW